MVPSEKDWVDPRPMKDNEDSLRIAIITENTNCDPITGNRLGRISTVITRHGR